MFTFQYFKGEESSSACKLQPWCWWFYRHQLAHQLHGAPGTHSCSSVLFWGCQLGKAIPMHCTHVTGVGSAYAWGCSCAGGTSANTPNTSQTIRGSLILACLSRNLIAPGGTHPTDFTTDLNLKTLRFKQVQSSGWVKCQVLPAASLARSTGTPAISCHQYYILLSALHPKPELILAVRRKKCFPASWKVCLPRKILIWSINQSLRRPRFGKTSRCRHR